MSSAIEGTYTSDTPGISKLVISSANDANGQMSGTVTVFPGADGVEETTLNFTGHYHYKNSNGPGVAFHLGAGKDSNDLYVGFCGTGTAENGSFNSLLLTGGAAIASNTKGSTFPLTATFIKQ